MDFTTILFILLNLFVLVYIIKLFLQNKRIHIVSELLFGLIYSLVLLIVLFPQILTIIENVFGIQSALNLIIYLSIFVAYFLIFNLYNDKETLRAEITKLTREIALMKSERKNKK
ncbi:MAG: DUF2304 family protein [Nanoarchaeota archaeon]